VATVIYDPLLQCLFVVVKVSCGASCGWLALMEETAAELLHRRPCQAPTDRRARRGGVLCDMCVEGRQSVGAPDDGNTEASSIIKLKKMREVFFHEIVLSAPPNAGTECMAMVMLANSTMVAFCRVGVDSAWPLLNTNLECSVDCNVHCQEKIFTIDINGDVSMCNCNAGASAHPTATPLLSLLEPADSVCNCNYLESNGELHMVGDTVIASLETKNITYKNVVYKIDFLLDQTLL
jgi:hypothetical protein